MTCVVLFGSVNLPVFFFWWTFHTCKLQFLSSAIFGLISIIQHDMCSFWNNVANPKVEDLGGGKPSAILLNSHCQWSEVFWLFFFRNKSSGSNFGGVVLLECDVWRRQCCWSLAPNVHVFQQMLKPRRDKREHLECICLCECSQYSWLSIAGQPNFQRKASNNVI